MKAKIFEVKRFAVHDGDGIRTTVFFKGCSLKCLWCHNPEGISFDSQLAYFGNKCINCSECVKVCKSEAQIISDGKHLFVRDLCTGCGACEKVCAGSALKLYGKEMSVEELMPILLEDTEFYNNSGGGITLSGGECLCQADFCARLLCELSANKIHTAVDTCGNVSRESIDKVLPFTDVFLYDVKAIDDDIHIKCTGMSNRLILENLKYIDSCGKNIEIRIPFVPEYNANQIRKIAEFTANLKNVSKVRVLPFHNLAGSKYQSLGMNNTLPKVLPTIDDLDKTIRILEDYNIKVVK